MLAETASVVDAEKVETLKEDLVMARPNYSGEKRRKDLAKKAKKEEKRLRKLHAKENPAPEETNFAEPDDADNTDDASESTKAEA